MKWISKSQLNGANNECLTRRRRPNKRAQRCTKDKDENNLTAYALHQTAARWKLFTYASRSHSRPWWALDVNQWNGFRNDLHDPSLRWWLFFFASTFGFRATWTNFLKVFEAQASDDPTRQAKRQLPWRLKAAHPHKTLSWMGLIRRGEEENKTRNAKLSQLIFNSIGLLVECWAKRCNWMRSLVSTKAEWKCSDRRLRFLFRSQAEKRGRKAKLQQTFFYHLISGA